MAKMYKHVYYGDKIVNSEDATISVASSAVLYGLSVYTVFPVHIDGNKKQAFRLKRHFQRLINSSKIIGISTFVEQWTYEKFEKAVKELLEANDLNKDIYVRATVHVSEEIAGTKVRGLPHTMSMFIYDAEPILSPQGCRLRTSLWRRIPDNSIPSRAKVNGAYVNSVLAKQDAIDSGYDDCIFLDINGHVCELSAANIFMVRGNTLITPGHSSDILEGINRSTVLELAEDLGIETVEREIDLTELYLADEVFACGTSANIAPVLEIDGRQIADGKVGPIAQKLLKAHVNARKEPLDAHTDWLTSL